MRPVAGWCSVVEAYYDPDDPSVAFLEPGSGGPAVLVLTGAGVLFLLIGIGIAGPTRYRCGDTVGWGTAAMSLEGARVSNSMEAIRGVGSLLTSRFAPR